MTKIFNPNDFAPTTETVVNPVASSAEQRCYEVTGNSLRDAVRKIFFEIFSADQVDEDSAALLIVQLENQIYKLSPDPKSRQYRDNSRALQNKLKGSRFTVLRQQLLAGETSVEEVCSAEFLNGKSNVAASTMPAKPQGAPGRGAPGQAVKPRGAPVVQFRPPSIAKPIIPISAVAEPEMPRVEEPLQIEELKVETQPSNQQAVIAPQPEANDTTMYTSFQLDASQTREEDLSLEVSQDLINSSLPPSGVAKKKKKGTKKKKKVEESEQVEFLTPQNRNCQTVEMPEQIVVPLQVIEEESKEEQPQVQQAPPVIHTEILPEVPQIVEEPQVIPQPPQVQKPSLPQQRAQPVLLSPSKQRQIDFSENRVDQLFQENQRLRQQLRQQSQYEETLMHQDHQIQLLQAQLKGRDEQVLSLRWQLQQLQTQHQKEVDDYKQRIRRIHHESQQFRDLICQQRQEVRHSNAVPISRNEELTADRGSNFATVRNYQHGDAEVVETNLESGEADEGGRDDGHFYRNTTADEGTGGAGESYQQQQRMVDVSGSGQMPGAYQRFETQYGVQSEGVQQIHEDDFDDDDEQYQTSQQLFEQSVQNVVVRQSSSGSAFGEGNQQDDSEEGVGMGMGNRQGSGHDVEDESGSLDVIHNVNSGQQFKFGQKDETAINNQSDGQEPQQHVAEEDQEELHSLGEEGGCRSNGVDDVDYNSQHQSQHYMEPSQNQYSNRVADLDSQEGSMEDEDAFNIQNAQFYYQMEEEESKEEVVKAPVFSDNVERPQPFHPRQPRAGQVVGAVTTNTIPQQNTFMQGESISGPYPQDRSVPQIMKTSMGGVAVVSKSKQQLTDSQAGDRPGAPGQPQRRGNKQQFQVPPLPPQNQNSGGSTKGQGQGGGVVGQNQSSSQTRNRNTRGTQRTNLQQQVFATTPNIIANNAQQTSSIQEASPPRVQRPPASLASAAQLPIGQQNSQKSVGGATGGIYRKTQPQTQFLQEHTQFQNFGNQQSQNSSPTARGVCFQASTMPASQASVSGQGNNARTQQQHNGGPSERQSQPQSSQSAPGLRSEGVVHIPGSQQPTSSTQVIGQGISTIMGSSGSAQQIIGGDIGGLTERNNPRNVKQMNAESGSTTEFTAQRTNFPPYLGAGGSNAMQTTQAYQLVSSPPSTNNNARTVQPPPYQYLSVQQSTNTQEGEGTASGGGEAELFVASVGATPLAQNPRGAISQAHPPPSRQQNAQQASLRPVPSESGEPEQQIPGTNQGESGLNVNRNYSAPVIHSQQAHTDSRKTSGANTPSKDGADTPPYRDQLQNNSYILNLTSKRLLGLQRPADMVSDTGEHQRQRTADKVIPRNMFE